MNTRKFDNTFSQFIYTFLLTIIYCSTFIFIYIFVRVISICIHVIVLPTVPYIAAENREKPSIIAYCVSNVSLYLDTYAYTHRHTQTHTDTDRHGRVNKGPSPTMTRSLTYIIPWLWRLSLAFTMHFDVLFMSMRNVCRRWQTPFFLLFILLWTCLRCLSSHWEFILPLAVHGFVTLSYI